MTDIQVRAAVQTVHMTMRGLVLRQLFPVGLVALGFWVFRERIAELDFSSIQSAIRQVQAHQWGIAIAATAASFWAIGRYDEVLHGLLDTDVAKRTARASGVAAIAVAQFVGFGVLSGALVRWRMLPGFSLWQSVRISLAVSLSFLAGWATITAFFLLVWGNGTQIPTVIPAAILATCVCLCALSLLDLPRCPKLPPIWAFSSILWLVSIDLLFSGVALFALLPPELALAPLPFLAIFLLAFGAGLICGTPAGFGPFELTLIALLPVGPAEPILASVLAFRLIYHVMPASIATLALIRGQEGRANPETATFVGKANSPYLPPELEQAVWKSNRAETNLLRQGDFGLLSERSNLIALAAPRGQSLIMLGDPVAQGTHATNTMNSLVNVACRKKRTPVLYKCSTRTACFARKKGWAVAAIVEEAWINPQEFSCEGSQRRQMRRMTRKAENSGVVVREGGRQLPLKAMEQLARDWATTHGGERGFSMGRFDRDYVKCQRVFLACIGDKLVAFLTLHQVETEWTVDLMRQSDAAPDGTMHLLILRAIENARESPIDRFSLAAVPLSGHPEGGPVGTIRKYIHSNSGAEGLRRFKASFAPKWITLYAAAPGRISLAIGLFDTLREVKRG